MLTRCPTHGRPLRDASLCAACVTELERNLVDLAAFTEDLVTTLTRLDRVPKLAIVTPSEEMLARARGRVLVHPGPHGSCTETGQHVHLAAWQAFLAGLSEAERAEITESDAGLTAKVQPLPFDATASKVLAATRNDLVGWVRVLHAGRPPAGPAHRRCWHPSCVAVRAEGWPEDTLPGMCRWLLMRVPAIRVHAAGQDLLGSVADMVDVARKTIDLRPDLWFAGVCHAPLPGDGRCASWLYAEMSDGTVTCSGCGASHDVAARRRDLLAAAEDQLETATHLAQALTRLGEPVTAERIWKWRERGRLTEHGVDVDGHPTYRVGDVIDLLNQAAEREARRVG